MFLSKRSNGIYYIWFADDTGKKCKISAGCRFKPEAMVFLKDFFKREKERRISLQEISLNIFVEEYLAYSVGVQQYLLPTNKVQFYPRRFDEVKHNFLDVMNQGVALRHNRKFAYKTFNLSDPMEQTFRVEILTAGYVCIGTSLAGDV